MNSQHSLPPPELFDPTDDMHHRSPEMIQEETTEVIPDQSPEKIEVEETEQVNYNKANKKGTAMHIICNAVPFLLALTVFFIISRSV